MDPSNNNAFDSFGNNAGAGNGASVGGASAGAGIGSGATITSPNTGATNSGSIVSSGATAVNNDYTSNSFPEGGLTIGGDKKRSRKGLIIAGIVLFVLAIGGGLAALAAINGVFGGGVINDNMTEASVYELMKNSYSDVNQVQMLFIEAMSGEYSSRGSFLPESREYINKNRTIINGFYDSLTKINTQALKSESVREKIDILKQNLSEDINIYNDTFDLYDLFYDYVNNNYADEYATLILDKSDNADVKKVLSDLNAIVDDTEATIDSSNIITEIFSVYTNEDSFVDVMYYKLIGDLIAELEGDE